MTKLPNRSAIIAVILVFACATAVAQQGVTGPLALRTDLAASSSETAKAEDAATAPREPLTLKHAVELALQHSIGLAMATADQNRAERGVAESRYSFIPQITIGSGLGYSQGFPLSLENLAPSLLNVNSSAYVLNLAQRELIKASRHQLAAMTKMADERRAQVVFDTAITYSELDSLENSMNDLRQQQQAASRVQYVAQQRTQAGVDSPVELTKAKLALARVRLSMEQSQGQLDLLRARLSQLTGVPGAHIQTISDSIPAIPVPVDAREFLPRVVSASRDLQAAQETALAKESEAKAEHRQMWPTMDYAMQYAALARYNNYDVYFRRDQFQRNNITAGVVIRFPLFNAAQKAHAEAADFESLKAQKQAEDVKNQVTNAAMKLHQSIRQLAAARDVAQLEYQLATTDVQAVQARMDSGGATVRDQENAHLAERQKFAAYMEANFDVEKALLQLLLSTGEIESWATSGK